MRVSLALPKRAHHVHQPSERPSDPMAEQRTAASSASSPPTHTGPQGGAGAGGAGAPTTHAPTTAGAGQQTKNSGGTNQLSANGAQHQKSTAIANKGAPAAPVAVGGNASGAPVAGGGAGVDSPSIGTKQQQQQHGYAVWVGNLPSSVTSTVLSKSFEVYGPVKQYVHHIGRLCARAGENKKD